jgi:hypothetical protein
MKCFLFDRSRLLMLGLREKARLRFFAWREKKNEAGSARDLFRSIDDDRRKQEANPPRQELSAEGRHHTRERRHAFIVGNSSSNNNNNNMPLEQLTFTPNEGVTANEHPNTMVLMVHPDQLERYRKDKSTPLVEVVDSFQVFKYETPGHSGKLAHPSRAELKNTFGSTNETEIVEFMLEHGQLHGKHKPKAKPEEKEDTVSHLLDAPRRAY